MDGSETEKIDDLYDGKQEIEKEQDPAKIRRENLLNIYKEPVKSDEKSSDLPDLSKGIKYKHDDEEDDS